MSFELSSLTVWTEQLFFFVKDGNSIFAHRFFFLTYVRKLAFAARSLVRWFDPRVDPSVWSWRILCVCVCVGPPPTTHIPPVALQRGKGVGN